ncbi:hypothetical protein Tco_0763744 [Tanacetum coccineum]
MSWGDTSSCEMAAEVLGKSGKDGSDIGLPRRTDQMKLPDWKSVDRSVVTKAADGSTAVEAVVISVMVYHGVGDDGVSGVHCSVAVIIPHMHKNGEVVGYVVVYGLMYRILRWSDSESDAGE